MVNLNTPMARAFFDHYGEKRQKARRINATAHQPQPIDVASFTSKVGDGTTSTDNGTLSITYGTTTTALRGSKVVTAGKRYRLSWLMAGAGGQAAFGTVIGGTQYRPALAGVVGANLFEFTAQTGEIFIAFQRTAAGTSTFSRLTILEIPEVSWLDTDLITPASFTGFSTGVTMDSQTGVITIPATGTQAFARGPIATEIGKAYRLRYMISGATAFAAIGTSAGGTQLKSVSASESGSRTYEFVATATTTWIQFHRTTTGTAMVADIKLQVIAPDTHFSDEFSQEFA